METGDVTEAGGTSAEQWNRLLSSLSSVEQQKVVSVCRSWAGAIEEQRELIEALDLSEHAFKVTKDSDERGVGECFRAGLTEGSAAKFEGTLAIRLLRQAHEAASKGADSSAALLALQALIDSDPETLYLGEESLLQRALRDGAWDVALNLVQQGASVNHEDKGEESVHPLETLIEALSSDEDRAVPTELLDALLTSEALDLTHVDRSTGSPIALIDSLASTAPGYEIPDSFLTRVAESVRGDAAKLNPYQIVLCGRDPEEEVPTLGGFVVGGEQRMVDWLISLGADPNSPSNLGRTPLMLCAELDGETGIAMARTLLGQGADPNCLDSKGTTALHWALQEGRDDLATLLIDWEGTDLNAHCDEMGTPLMACVERGNLSVAQELLNKGADVNAADAKGITALHKAVLKREADHALVSVFIKEGASLNAYSKVLGTPLRCACNVGDFACASLLLEGGASPDDPGEGIFSPLTQCVSHSGGEALAIRLIKSGCCPSKALGRRGRPLLPFLASAGMDDVLRAAVEAAVKLDLDALDGIKGQTALSIYAEKHDWERVRLLLDKGASIKQGRLLPLHAALRARRGKVSPEGLLGGLWMELIDETTAQGALGPLLSSDWASHGKEAVRLQEELCQEIVKYDKEIFARSGRQAPPLKQALSYGRMDLARAMLRAAYGEELPADLPWLSDALSWKGADKLVGLLFDMGLPRDALVAGKPLLHWATERNCELLVHLASVPGIDLDVTNPTTGQTVLHLCSLRSDFNAGLEALLKAGAAPDAKDTAGNTPLALACVGETGDGRYKNVDAIELLLEAKADPNGRMPDGSPYLVALCKGDDGDVATRAVGLFQRAGVSFDAQDSKGKTYLHHWAELGSRVALPPIPKDFALVKIQDADGNTPLHIAYERSPHSLLTLLEHFEECEGLLDVENGAGVTVQNLMRGKGDTFIQHLKRSGVSPSWHKNLRQALLPLFLEKGEINLGLSLLSVDDKRDASVRAGLLKWAASNACQELTDALLPYETPSLKLLGQLVKSGQDAQALRVAPRDDAASGAVFLEQGRPDLFDRWMESGGELSPDSARLLLSDDETGRKRLVALVRAGKQLPAACVAEMVDSKEERTALLECLQQDSTPLEVSHVLHAFSSGHVKLGKRLLQHLNPSDKSIADWTDSEGRSLLHYAVMAGNQDFVCACADAGVQTDRQDKKGNSVLHYAAIHGRLKVAKKLGPSDSRVSTTQWTTNRAGKTAFQIILEKFGGDVSWTPCIEGYLKWMRISLQEEKASAIYQLVAEKGFAQRAAEVWYGDAGKDLRDRPEAMDKRHLNSLPDAIRRGMTSGRIESSSGFRVSDTSDTSDSHGSTSPSSESSSSTSPSRSVSTKSQATSKSRATSEKTKEPSQAKRIDKRIFVAPLIALASVLGLRLILRRYWPSFKV